MNLGIRKKVKVDDESAKGMRCVAQSFWSSKPRKDDSFPKVSEPDSKSQCGASGGSPSLLGYVGGSFVGTYTNKEIEQQQSEEQQATSATPSASALVDDDPFGLRKNKKKRESADIDFSKYDSLFKTDQTSEE